MNINELMRNKKITKYRLSKDSGIPYTTVNDICSGNTLLEKASAETVYKLAKALGVSMEFLLEPCFAERNNFELFKSNICHRVKELGDVDFIVETLENNEILTYYRKKWYPECFYLLAMLDYLSRMNNVPLCNKYDNLRQYKLDEPIYPAGILAISAASKDESIKEKARRESIPEFIRFNIVESEVRNVV